MPSHHLWLKDYVSYAILSTLCNLYYLQPSMPFHGVLSNRNTHVHYSFYGKTLPGSCAPDLLIISNDKDFALENRWPLVSVTYNMITIRFTDRSIMTWCGNDWLGWGHWWVNRLTGKTTGGKFGWQFGRDRMEVSWWHTHGHLCHRYGFSMGGWLPTQTHTWQTPTWHPYGFCWAMPIPNVEWMNYSESYCINLKFGLSLPLIWLQIYLHNAFIMSLLSSHLLSYGKFHKVFPSAIERWAKWNCTRLHGESVPALPWQIQLSTTHSS